MLVKNLVLKGWHCPKCCVFNGEEKEKRYECRCCGWQRRTNHRWSGTSGHGTKCVDCDLVRTETTRDGIKRKRYRYFIEGTTIEFLGRSPNCPGEKGYDQISKAVESGGIPYTRFRTRRDEVGGCGDNP